MIEVKITTPMSEIDKYLEEAQKQLIQHIRDALIEAGREAVEEARANGQYQDRTGNLRSSIGAVVAMSGEVVWESDFNVVLGGEEGAAKGRELALSKVIENSDAEFCIVLVAGEDYAIYVQAVHGLDVMAGGEALLREQLESTVPIKMQEVKV